MRQVMSLLRHKFGQVVHIDQGALLIFKEHIKDPDLNHPQFLVVAGVRIRVYHFV